MSQDDTSTGRDQVWPGEPLQGALAVCQRRPWWIAQNQVEGAKAQEVALGLFDARTEHRHRGLDGEGFCVLLDAGERGSSALDEDDPFGPARERLEAECSGPCVEVDREAVDLSENREP